MTGRVEAIPVPGLPEIGSGDRLGAMIAAAAMEAGIEPATSDVVVISQKVVSKAEGRVRDLSAVRPGARALELSTELGKDPRLVELVLAESRRIVRSERGVLIVETKTGWICANAGIDASNVPGGDSVTLLPLDPDASARRMRDEIADECGHRPAVVVSDSFGRPWRLGQADVAIGCAGLLPVDDWEGRGDVHGRDFTATAIAVADQIAAAADLARDQTTLIPAVLIRGAGQFVTDEDGPGATALQRPGSDDLFR
jgi:coenzyme F420-0:L-glutamate ligase/coenzyme F420-1:gamma-L-glutamate ligase